VAANVEGGNILTKKEEEKMKKGCFVILAVVLFLALFFAGGNVISAADKPIDLKLSHIMSPMHHLHVNVFVPFAKEVEERTKGRVKVSLYPAEAMGKAKDHYDMALTGISDISFILPSYTAGRFPLTGVMELPIGIPSADVGSLVIWDLYGKYLKSEYPGVKVLTIWTNQPGHIYTNKKVPHEFSNFVESPENTLQVKFKLSTEFLCFFHGDRKKQILFVFKVLINAAFGDARPSSYFRHSGRLEAFLAEDFYGRLDDRVPSYRFLENTVRGHRTDCPPSVIFTNDRFACQE
jgi:hypothetical protein